MKKLILILFISSLFYSCNREAEQLKSEWKYQEGFHFGDWLDFKNTDTKLADDTIYLDTKPYCKLVQIKKGYFGLPTKLYMQQFNSDEIGVYITK